MGPKKVLNGTRLSSAMEVANRLSNACVKQSADPRLRGGRSSSGVLAKIAAVRPSWRRGPCNFRHNNAPNMHQIFGAPP